MSELLPIAGITVQFVNDVKPDAKVWKDGERRGSIKTPDGQFYQVKEKMLPQFVPGMSCKVEYKARPKDGGGEWREVTKIIGNGAAAPIVPKHTYQAQKNPSESRQIAIMAMLKCFKPLDTGDREGLQANVDVCTAVYERSFSGRQHRDDMDDSIGF